MKDLFIAWLTAAKPYVIGYVAGIATAVVWWAL